MPYRTMSLEEFAVHVGMDAREVRKLADRGRLPGQKVGGEWHFNRARVTEWLQQEMPHLEEKRLIEIEEAMGKGDNAGPLVVTDLIGVEGIELNLPARTRSSVLRELVKLVERTGLLWDEKALLEAIERREELGSTAMPGGVAIPHARQPLPHATDGPVICLGRVPGGIPFGASDRSTTDLFFLLCNPEDRQHLRVLARLVRILDPDTLSMLREIECPDAALAALIARERQVAART